MRPDGRRPDELRSIVLERNYLRGPDGSALVAFGHTKVICTAIIEEQVPPFLRNTGRGWVTAEYAMLPGSGSTGGRINRASSQRGRAQEISRLIGRSLRAVTRLEGLGERQITVDCDVIQADGGTRTAAITGGYIALYDAVSKLAQQGKTEHGKTEHGKTEHGTPLGECIIAQCAAVSVGICGSETYLDLCYEEDAAAVVDLNVVMKSDGGIIEIQGTAEGQVSAAPGAEHAAPNAELGAFDRARLNAMLDLSESGLRLLFQRQRECLSGD